MKDHLDVVHDIFSVRVLALCDVNCSRCWILLTQVVSLSSSI